MASHPNNNIIDCDPMKDVIVYNVRIDGKFVCYTVRLDELEDTILKYLEELEIK